MNKIIIMVILFSTVINAQWRQTVFNERLGFSNMSVYSLAASRSSVFVGTDGGVFMSKNNGAKWEMASSDLPTRIVTCLSINGSNILAGTSRSGFFLSSNNGYSWSAINHGLEFHNLPNYDLTYNTITAIVEKNNDIFLSTMNRGVFLSNDNEKDWVAVNTGLVNKFTHTLKSVNSLVINDNNIFAGTIDGEIFHSTNNGKIWTAVDSGLKNVTYVITLTVCNNTIFAGTSTGVFLSHNNGMLWTSASSGLPYNHNYSTHIAAQCFAVSDSNIFVGIRNGGVFISKDIGKSWTEINYGLNTEAQFLAVNDSYIFTGSSTGGGVWRRSLKEVE